MSTLPLASWHPGTMTGDPKRGWEWVAPAEWPVAPEGFRPPPGWEPEPAWPAVPSSHVFWQRTKRGIRMRRLKFLLVSLAVLIPSACAVAVAVGPPCFFDPPPGDQLSVEVLNDSKAQVAVVDCLNDRCSSAQSRTLIRAGATAAMPLEGCQGGTMGVLNPPTDTLAGCIAEPTEDSDFRLPPVSVSEARACTNAVMGQHVKQVGSG